MKHNSKFCEDTDLNVSVMLKHKIHLKHKLYLYGIKRTSKRKSNNICMTSGFSVNSNIFCLSSLDSGILTWPKIGKTS